MDTEEMLADPEIIQLSSIIKESFTNLRNLVFYYDNDFIFMFTPSEYFVGSSISHLDNSFYDASEDFIMKPFGSKGVTIANYKPVSEIGIIGKKVLLILKAIGYSVIDFEYSPVYN
jgi:hypothetical protein